MNYISFLQDQREETARQLLTARTELVEILHYLQSSKFNGPDADYVHVRTDILPKLTRLNTTLAGI